MDVGGSANFTGAGCSGGLPALPFIVHLPLVLRPLTSTWRGQSLALESAVRSVFHSRYKYMRWSWTVQRPTVPRIEYTFQCRLLPPTLSAPESQATSQSATGSHEHFLIYLAHYMVGTSAIWSSLGDILGCIFRVCYVPDRWMVTLLVPFTVSLATPFDPDGCLASGTGFHRPRLLVCGTSILRMWNPRIYFVWILE